jgi:hypothetical protein
MSKIKKKEAKNFIKINENEKVQMIPNESGMFEIGASDVLTSV